MSIRMTMGTLMLVLTIAAAGCSVPAARSGLPIQHNLPPAQMLMQPGPGVGGPGPGVIAPGGPSGSMGMMGGPSGPGMGMGFGGGMMEYGAAPGLGSNTQNVQILFAGPEAAQVRWDVGNVGTFDSEPMVVPGRQNFAQGGVYKLKLTNIDGREGIELYPSLELGPTTPRTAAYLAHAAIPVKFTEEDLDQVLAGNFVTKVIYIPDPEFQELAAADVDTLVSTRLDPGVDPIVEADRRGAILAIIRLGNKDQEMPGSSDGGFAAQASFGGPVSSGAPGVGSFGGSTPNYISGVTAPAYGMPITGTPIGLPGPAHIPLGVPAGLRKHTVHNHTAMQIPGPTRQMNVHVQQDPGLSYPRPADTVLIREQTVRPPHFNVQPAADMIHGTPPVRTFCPQ